MVQDPANLAAVREKLAVEGVTQEQRHVLNIMEKTFKVNIIEDERAAALKVPLCTNTLRFPGFNDLPRD